jgi:hypothetical protein
VGVDAQLLVLLYGAWERTGPLAGELRSWQHDERSQQAFRVAGHQVGSFSLLRRSGDDRPEETELCWRFVSGSGGRYRQELIPGTADPLMRQRHLEGNDGQRAWAITDGQVYINPPRPSEATQRLLDPAWVLTHDLEVTGRRVSSGRPVVQVRATARPARLFSGSAKDMALERDLVVDAERGFLHADTALVDGLPYDILELRDVQIDSPIDLASFELEVPPGAEVIDTSSYQPDFQAPWDRHRWRWRLRHVLARRFR